MTAANGGLTITVRRPRRLRALGRQLTVGDAPCPLVETATRRDRSAVLLQDRDQQLRHFRLELHLCSRSSPPLLTLPFNTSTHSPPFLFIQAQPTALTVAASASGGNLYTIATLPGTATNIVWSPFDVQETAGIPLAVATYTLSIWDERGPKATPDRGRMSPYTGLSFALYRPAAYTPLSSASFPVLFLRVAVPRAEEKRMIAGWTCATCSGAAEVMRCPAFFLAFATIFAMVVSGWGLLRVGSRR